jgi:rhamnulose-1-phosphate aldolase
MKLFGKHSGLKGTAREMSAVSEYLWYKGWAERNAGNMSINVTERINQKELLADGEKFELETPYPELAGQYLLLSGTGVRMRDLARKPAKNLCLIYIGTGGRHYMLFREGIGPLMPTSELPTHLSIHQKLIISGRKEKALLHTHVNELIALTQIQDFTNEESINKLLWGMHPETLLFIPEGVGFIPYTLPGTEEIAKKTLASLDAHSVVIWEKHGCLAVGENLIEAFDQIDILAKSANIFFTCRNAGFEPQGMTEKQLEEIRHSISNSQITK